MADDDVHTHIEALVAEEHRLWQHESSGNGSDEDRRRLAEIKVELDRCYDLLHQREARRAAGLDPEEATLRPVEVVERYQQ